MCRRSRDGFSAAFIPEAYLFDGHTYAWYVAAATNGGYGPWSTPKIFTVIAQGAVTPTPAPTYTPTNTPTPTSVCQVTVALTSIDYYDTARDAAIADPARRIGWMAQSLLLDVYARSDLYLNLVQVTTYALSGRLVWIDSGGGAVNLVEGSNCSGLDNHIIPETINNPTTRPTYTAYPFSAVSAPSPSDMELLQFALRYPRYGLTAWRHPGTDFLQGPVSLPTGIGIRVAAIADGTVIGYCDPCILASQAVGPIWVQGVSPTDAPDRAYVVVRHGNTIVVYAHLQPGLRLGIGINRIGNALGAPVVAGQWLGQIADHPDGPHLHLEVRSYGTAAYNEAIPPPVYVNAWQYFNSTIQGYIDANVVKRATDDGQAAPGWNGVYSAGSQRTQCFTSPANPPTGAQTPGGPQTGGIIVYGYDTSGTPNYSAFEWIDPNGTPQAYPATLAAPFHTFCIP